MSSKYRYLLSEKINELTMLQNYIQELEEKANKNAAHDVELFTVEVNKDNIEVSCYLYTLIPTFEKSTATCNKCNNGFIREKNDFSSEYRLCDCKLDKLKYIVKDVPVHRIEIIDDNTWYITYEDNKEIRINGRIVCDEFGDDFLSYKFCKSRESCERLCELINDKQ